MTTVSDETKQKISSWVKTHEKEYIDALIQLVNIKSVAGEAVGDHPFGDGVAKALDYVLQVSKEYGFEVENDDYYCGSAILPGKEIKPGIAFVGHLDVVPEGEGWSYPPYDARVIQGQITGRGSSDNKGPALAALFALRCVKELGFLVKHTFQVLFGCQEECGMNDMPYYLEQHKENLPQLFLVCDCPFPIHYGEKGIMILDLVTELSGNHIHDFHGGVVTNSVPDKAVALLKNISFDDVTAQIRDERICVSQETDFVKVSAAGVGGHAAFPEGTVNAIGILAEALARLGQLDVEEKRAMQFLARMLSKHDGSELGIAAESTEWGKNTAVGGYVTLQDNRLVQNINIRYIGSTDHEAMLEQIKRAAKEEGFWLEHVDNSAPMYMSLDSMNGLPRKILALAEELLEMGPLKPEILAGGTHARKLPNAIGFGPDMDTDPPCLGHAHAQDESVRLDIMERAIRVYAAAIIAIDEMLD